MDNQQKESEEYQQMTEWALIHAWNLGLSEQDMAILARHAGLDYRKFIVQERS